MCGWLPATEGVVTIGTSTVPFIGPNPRRHTLIVWVPSGNRVTLSTRSNVTLNNGITLANLTAPYCMKGEDWGDWFTTQIFAVCDVAGVQVTYVEVTDIEMPIPTMPGLNRQQPGVNYGYPARRGSTT